MHQRIINMDNNNTKVIDWSSIPDEICELMRQGAELGLVLISNSEVLDEFEDASRENESGSQIQDDPVVSARNRRATRTAIMHWLNRTIEHPNQPVPPILLADAVSNARELHRSGALQILHNNSRTAHDIAWQYWMNVAFQLSDQPNIIQQILEISSMSISHYIEGCLKLTLEQLEKDNQLLTTSKIEQQRELVSRIIEGETIDLIQAKEMLNYSLTNSHHCAIIWSEEIDVELSALEKIAEAFQQASQQDSGLKIISNNSVVWVWTPAIYPINTKYVESALQSNDSIRLTYASANEGIDGFRRAYLDALSAQRVLGRLKSSTKLVSYERVRLMAFLSKDSKSIQHYSEHVLGELAQAPTDIRRSLHAFLECGCNATEAAKKLHTHRNTLLRRLNKAEEMLPRPLSENRIQVAVALEALYWIL